MNDIDDIRADGTTTNITRGWCEFATDCPQYAVYYTTTATDGTVPVTAYFDALGREVRSVTSNVNGQLVMVDTHYDALGRVEKSSLPYFLGTAANDIKYNTVTYDALDRMILRLEDEGASTWTYDTSPVRGIGKLHTLTGPTYLTATERSALLADFTTANVPVKTGMFSRAHTYDQYGRPETTTTTMDDGSSYEMGTAYDAVGRVTILTYPENVAPHAPEDPADRLQIENVYDVNGFLREVKNATTQYTYWQLGRADGNTVGAVNPAGQVLIETVGNTTTVRSINEATGKIEGITTGFGAGDGTVQNLTFAYDSLGNLEQRGDQSQVGADSQPLNEVFTYDALNRLKTVTLNGIQTQSLDYDAAGNITNNSRLGTYHYDGVFGPHAVDKITNGAQTVDQFSYDANGNLYEGGGRTVAFSSFNKPRHISKGGVQVYSFLYGADHFRFKQVGPQGTLYYLRTNGGNSPLFEREIGDTGITKDQHFIYVGGSMIAKHIVESTNERKTRYFHKDHIGSIAVMTDEFGNVPVDHRMSYTPFGERRNLDFSFSNVQIVIEASHHGFTGHEHLDEVGLIHMNGRIFDPRIGRFLSADPFVQNPESTQSYNRYSYLMNNPLSGTDPSGYFSLSDIFEPLFDGIHKIMGYVNDAIRNPVIQQIGSIVVSVFAPEFLPIYSSFMTAINGGTAQDIITSGVASYAYAEALDMIGGLQQGKNPIPNIEAVLLHGMVGGSMGAIQGGDFGSGFLSAAVGKAITIGTRGKLARGFEQGAVVAIAGGVTSVLGGGKFANGATTAAFSYMFGEAARSAQQRRLKVQFTSPNAEFYDSPEAAYIADGGDPDLVRSEIDRYAETPMGRQVMAQDGVLTVSATMGGPISAPIGGTHINYDGGRLNAFAHEIGHTVYGGSYCDYAGQTAGCGGVYSVGNVQAHENAFRAATGQSLRLWYLETDPNKAAYGQRFYVGP